MDLNKKIENYLNAFEYKQKGEDKENKIIVFKADRPSDLFDSVYKAHGERLPNDWIFNIYYSILESLSGYEIDSMENIDDKRAELVDSLVNVYTSDLTAWLASDINNVYYLTEAIDQYEAKDGFRALATAQSIFIDEIFGEVVSLLESGEDN